MINQQILDYIKQQVRQGVSREQIKSSLMTNGWQSADVEEAFNLINTQGQLSQSDIVQRPKSFNKTVLLVIIVIGVLVIGGGVMGYFAFVGRDKMVIPPSSVSFNPPLTETPVSTSSPATTETPVPATPPPVVIKPTPTITPKPTPATQPIVQPTIPTPATVPVTVLITPPETKIPISFLKDDGSLIVKGEVMFNAIGKKFFANHADQYDFIHIFTVGYPSIQTPDQFVRVRANPAKGLGSIDSANPDPNYFGANQNGKLMGLSYIGLNLDSDQIQLYPEDLAFRALLEEIAHNWGVFIGNQYGGGGLEIREADMHWWRGLQTIRDFDSMREAGPWKDNGDGTFSLPIGHCTAGPRIRSYSPFMLYLMGLADPKEITQSFLLIKSPELQADICKETVKGTAQKITINDLISSAGKARTITTANSQKDFQMAFIVVYPKGAVISNQATNNINWIAQNLPIKWAEATSCRSSVNGKILSSQSCATTVFPK